MFKKKRPKPGIDWERRLIPDRRWCSERRTSLVDPRGIPAGGDRRSGLERRSGRDRRLAGR